jgi:hypothetical protein
MDDVEPGLLFGFSHRGLLDGLALLDPAARHDGGEIRMLGKVEDEELVGTRDGVLARDVDGDWRARSQCCPARSLAL